MISLVGVRLFIGSRASFDQSKTVFSRKNRRFDSFLIQRNFMLRICISYSSEIPLTPGSSVMAERRLVRVKVTGSNPVRATMQYKRESWLEYCTSNTDTEVRILFSLHICPISLEGKSGWLSNQLTQVRVLYGAM